MQAEARHHLVEDEHSAVAIAQITQALQKARPWGNQIHIACDRFDDDAGDLVRMLSERGGHLVQIVVRQDPCFAGNRLRHAGRRRLTEGKCTRTGLHQQTVAVTVIAAFEFDDFRPSGEPARETKRGHRRLGSGRHQPHHFQ